MPGFDVDRVIAAYQAGKQIALQREQLAKQKEDREFEIKRRQLELSAMKLTHQQALRQGDVQNAQLMENQPAPQVEQQSLPPLNIGSNLPIQPQPIDGMTPAAVPGQQMPGLPSGVGTGSNTIPGFLPKVPVRALEEGGEPVFIQPRTREENNAQKVADLIQAMQFKRLENQTDIPAIPDLGIPSPITVDKSVAPTIISQAGQNTRQGQQQEFTAAENEKRLKAEAEKARLDRISREQVSFANRVQRAATAAASGRSSKITQQALSLSSRFEANPVVRRYAVLKESVQFVNSLNPKTGNPADDQGLIYAFAKAMDPESVVREGEYATVQKYIQAWAEQFGFDVKRLYSNSPFLTEQARANIKATIASKAKASESTYRNLTKEYEKKFKNIGEDPTGWLTDYGTVTAPEGPSPDAWRIVP